MAWVQVQSRCNVEEAKLEVEAEKNQWLESQLAQSEQLIQEGQQEASDKATQLRSAQGQCEVLTRENELLKEQVAEGDAIRAQLAADLKSSRHQGEALSSENAHLDNEIAPVRNALDEAPRYAVLTLSLLMLPPPLLPPLACLLIIPVQGCHPSEDRRCETGSRT